VRRNIVEAWLEDYLSLNIGEASLVLGLVALVAPLLIRRVRALATSLLGRLGAASGRPYSTYCRWFIQQHGRVRNIYLNRIEELDLAATFVPLTVHSDGSRSESLIAATHLMSPAGPRRAIIVGDPGTGKTTLLKAYGTGVLRRPASLFARSLVEGVSSTTEFPVLITLRQIGKQIEDGVTLDELILDTLKRRARVLDPQRLLRRLLRQGRVTLLLDGLDEPSNLSYLALHTAIRNFACRDEDADLPTSMARIIISCRRQNFLRIKDDWIGWFSESYFTLAPLRNDEMVRLIEKRRADFPENRTPESFMADIRASGTLELHRIPLVLTISIGLYTQLRAYEIPSSITEFYDEMGKELLRRHDFRADDQFRMNRFQHQDKHRFLREFALHLANRPAPFDDFRYRDIVEFCSGLQPDIPRLRREDVHDFIDEIIDRSGLLVRTSDDGYYAFAHRALHEHLVARQLARDPSAGIAHLLERASDVQWRQVIVLFSGIEQPQVRELLTQLATRNIELAVSCLSTASVPTKLARVLIRKLSKKLDIHWSKPEGLLPLLFALVQATHAPADDVRDVAFEVLKRRLIRLARSHDRETQRRVSSALFGGEFPAAAKLLLLMSDESSAELAAAVSILAHYVPDSQSLVSPLWSCLSIPELAHTPTARSIVRRLLGLVMEPTNFAALQRLPPLRPSWVPDSFRQAAYPVKGGLPLSSNLVTLLGCAYTLKAMDDLPVRNAYLEAFHAPGRPLENIGERRSWARVVRLFYLIRVMAYASFALCIGFVIGTVPVADYAPYSNRSFWLSVLCAHFTSAAVIAKLTWIATDKYEGHAAFPLSRFVYLLPVPAARKRTTHRVSWRKAKYFAPGSPGYRQFSHRRRRARGSSPAAFGLPGCVGMPRMLTASFGLRPFLTGGYILPTLGLSTVYLPISALYSVPVTALVGPSWMSVVISCSAIVLLWWLPSTELCGKYHRFFGYSTPSLRSVYEDPRSRHWVVSTEKQGSTLGARPVVR
jgi:hypothetical protein